VRKRAPKPDISTVDGFKRSLLAAKSIGYNDPATGSPAGIHIAKIIERLGLVADLRTKIKLNSGSQPTFEALANGDIEIGFAIGGPAGRSRRPASRRNPRYHCTYRRSCRDHEGIGSGEGADQLRFVTDSHSGL
jgi:extracellular solute-binding protein